MKIVVFGDVHGNLPALELMVGDAKKVDQYICLGDVVNYGPWSNECVQFIAELGNCIKIKGNHEDYFIDGKCDANHFLVQEFFSFCYDNFEEKLLLKEYKKASKICSVSMVWRLLRKSAWKFGKHRTKEKRCCRIFLIWGALNGSLTEKYSQ